MQNFDKANKYDRLTSLIKSQITDSWDKRHIVPLLTLAPKSWSVRKDAIECNVTKYLLPKSRNLVELKSVFEMPDKYTDHGISDKTKILTQVFYEDNENMSRQMQVLFWHEMYIYKNDGSYVTSMNCTGNSRLYIQTSIFVDLRLQICYYWKSLRLCMSLSSECQTDLRRLQVSKISTFPDKDDSLQSNYECMIWQRSWTRNTSWTSTSRVSKKFPPDLHSDDAGSGTSKN